MTESRRRRAMLTALLLIGLAMAPVAVSPQTEVAATQGSLSRVQTLSPAGSDAGDPQLGLDSRGNAIFTWILFPDESDELLGKMQARARSASGSLGPVQTVSGAFLALSPAQLAVAADGRADFVWWSVGDVKTRARSANGVLGPTQTLSVRGGGFNPHVAVDSRGNAAFVWSGTSVEARTRSANGSLSPEQTIGISGGTSAFAAQVGVDTNRNTVFVWVTFDIPTLSNRIQARARSVSGALRPIQTLSAAGQHASSPKVAVHANGMAVFTWERLDGTNWRIQTRTRSVNGSLGGTKTLSAVGQDAHVPQVAIDASGNAVFTWERWDGRNWRIQASTRSVNGALSPTRTLSAAGQDARAPQVAVTGDGKAVFTWERSDGTNWRIQARTRSVDGTLGGTQTLSAGGEDADAHGPQVAIDASGNAVFTWERWDGTNWRIQARARSAD